MKKNILLLLLFSAVFITCCKDDDDGTQDPMDSLPEATQTGAQTFGCLINGEPFVPPSFGNNRPNAFYQFVDGAYTLGISGSSDEGGTSRAMQIGGIDIQEQIEITTYQLKSNVSNQYFGQVLLENIQLNSTTTSERPGQLAITRFDESIISGTFEFTILDNNGNEINITEGRFDMNYTN